MATKDPNSLSNSHLVKTSNLSWVFDVDFERKVLKGSVTYTASVLGDEVEEFVVDTKGLTIFGASDPATGASLQTNSGAPHAVFGTPVSVKLAGKALRGETVRVKIDYETSPDASAIQWLAPVQTKGGKHPYLFTQCQAIHARSMLPCQDAPSVKATYDAKVSVPKDLVALMSAERGEVIENGDKKTYCFSQKIGISSYLIALAVGALVSRDIGPRSKVWSEAEMVEAGAYEFAETEKFISIAEEIVGKYVWGTYDVLLLPPSFPYGGMENPMLTFVTPTLLAGDRSNADVVAHEVSHSWTGNLVTNRTWEHFWLNEGWTMFLERKILEKIHGEKFFHFDAILGWKHLQDDIDHFGSSNPLTKLMPNLEGIDPDDAFSSVPYEKGFNLIFYLENLVGGAEPFGKFFKHYIAVHHHKLVSSYEFKEFFLGYFADKVSSETLLSIDWEGWFNTPGMPIQKPKFDTTLAEASENLAKQWLAGGADVSIDGWTAKQILHFLDTLSEGAALTVETLQKMDALYHFTASNNAEIRFRWYLLGLKANWEPVVEPALEFVTSQGRMKFTRPVYRALFNSTVGKEKAIATFLKNRDSYHSICAKMVAKDLKLAE